MGFHWHCDCFPGFTLTHSILALKLLFLAMLELGALRSRNLEEALYKLHYINSCNEWTDDSKLFITGVEFNCKAATQVTGRHITLCISYNKLPSPSDWRTSQSYGDTGRKLRSVSTAAPRANIYWIYYTLLYVLQTGQFVISANLS